MNFADKNDWVERLRRAKGFAENSDVLRELNEYGAKDARFVWEVLRRVLQGAVDGVDGVFERDVYEYCLKVFELLEPGIREEKACSLCAEIEVRAPLILCRIPLKIGELRARERELADFFWRASQGEVLSEKELERRLKEAKTETVWAIVNFFLYSTLYTREVGRFPGGSFMPFAGIVTAFLCISKSGRRAFAGSAVSGLVR